MKSVGGFLVCLVPFRLVRLDVATPLRLFLTSATGAGHGVAQIIRASRSWRPRSASAAESATRASAWAVRWARWAKAASATMDTTRALVRSARVRSASACAVRSRTGAASSAAMRSVSWDAASCARPRASRGVVHLSRAVHADQRPRPGDGFGVAGPDRGSEVGPGRLDLLDGLGQRRLGVSLGLPGRLGDHGPGDRNHHVVQPGCLGLTDGDGITARTDRAHRGVDPVGQLAGRLRGQLAQGGIVVVEGLRVGMVTPVRDRLGLQRAERHRAGVVRSARAAHGEHSIFTWAALWQPGSEHRKVALVTAGFAHGVR